MFGTIYEFSHPLNIVEHVLMDQLGLLSFERVYPNRLSSPQEIAQFLEMQSTKTE